MSPAVRGALWMLGMAASISLMAVAARELTARHDPMEIQLMRHGISLAILLPIVAANRFRDVRTGSFKLQVFRNVSHFGATVGWYAAVAMLPLAEVFAIEFTTPLWTALLAVLFLGERFNRGRVIALALGLAGILVILRPGVTPVGASEAIMVAAAVGFALHNVATKALTRTDSVITVLLWMSIIQGALAVIPGTLSWAPVTAAELPWVVIAGITGLTTPPLADKGAATCRCNADDAGRFLAASRDRVRRRPGLRRADRCPCLCRRGHNFRRQLLFDPARGTLRRRSRRAGRRSAR